jgi:2,4'-dihydroxyacetophenone dioxygenase
MTETASYSGAAADLARVDSAEDPVARFREIVLQTHDLHWADKTLAGLSQKMLWRDNESRASIALVRFERGAGIPSRHAHASNQFMFCLSGRYTYTATGITLTSGSFYWNPKGGGRRLMPKHQLTSPDLAPPNGHFSQATEARGGRLVFISGMTARNGEGGVTGISDVAARTHQVCRNYRPRSPLPAARSTTSRAWTSTSATSATSTRSMPYGANTSRVSRRRRRWSRSPGSSPTTT